MTVQVQYKVPHCSVMLLNPSSHQGLAMQLLLHMSTSTSSTVVYSCLLTTACTVACETLHYLPSIPAASLKDLKRKLRQSVEKERKRKMRKLSPIASSTSFLFPSSISISNQNRNKNGQKLSDFVHWHRPVHGVGVAHKTICLAFHFRHPKSLSFPGGQEICSEEEVWSRGYSCLMPHTAASSEGHMFEITGSNIDKLSGALLGSSQ